LGTQAANIENWLPRHLLVIVTLVINLSHPRGHRSRFATRTTGHQAPCERRFTGTRIPLVNFYKNSGLLSKISSVLVDFFWNFDITNEVKTTLIPKWMTFVLGEDVRPLETIISDSRVVRYGTVR
jgi:hypothetical protein